MAIIKNKSDEFVASNGVPIKVASESGWFAIGSSSDLIVREEVEALREYFLQERDEQLGRFRADATHVVYRAVLRDDDDGRAVIVVDESDGEVGTFWEKLLAQPDSAGDDPDSVKAASAYFAALPEPKPWVDAQLGDLWMLTLEGQEHLAFVRKLNGELHFVTDTRGNWDFNVSRITAGHRIYPLVEES